MCQATTIHSEANNSRPRDLEADPLTVAEMKRFAGMAGSVSVRNRHHYRQELEAAGETWSKAVPVTHILMNDYCSVAFTPNASGETVVVVTTVHAKKRHGRTRVVLTITEARAAYQRLLTDGYEAF